MTAPSVLPIRRALSALFALLYLLLSAGGEALQHGGSTPSAEQALAHLHDPGDRNHDCPPPTQDENHCPAYKLTGLGFIPAVSGDDELALAWTTARTRVGGDALAPVLRSHAPPNLRAPPLG